jgi:PAS domain S-box-containing protein
MTATGTLGWETAFWAAFDASRNGMALVDGERCIAFANDALVELLQRSRDELVGASVLSLLPQNEIAPSNRAREQFLETGHQVGLREIVRADGAVIECEYAATRTEVPGRGPLALYVTIESRLVEPEPEVDDSLHRSAILTPRETEVVRMVALGKTSTEIAAELGVSNETVRTHVRNAMEKTGTHTRAALVAAAFARRLI